MEIIPPTFMELLAFSEGIAFGLLIAWLISKIRGQ